MTSEITKIVNCLLNGGVALVPTDTVYGLAVSPIDAAIDKLYRMKSRPRTLPLPIMIATADDLEPLGIEVNAYALNLFNSPYMPGALSLILGFKDQPLVPWLKGREEIAIRIPDDERLLAVLKKTGPLLVTSANKHGLPSPSTIEKILEQLDGEPDIAIEGKNIEGIASTIINCRMTPPMIERSGIISEGTLLKYIDL